MSTMSAMLDEIAKDLRHNLVSIDAPQGNRLFVDTPVLFPNGTSVAVQVSAVSDAVFYVSDAGLTSFEADLVCVDERFFSRLAKDAAADIGAQYKSGEIFFEQVARDELLGAVMLIASCAQTALVEATAKTAKRAYRKTQPKTLENVLYEVLAKAFSSQRLQKKVKLAGASAHDWTFGALIKPGNGADSPAVFDAVSAHPQSLNSAVAKFYDVKQLESPPARCALIEDKQKFAQDKLTLLSGLCNIVTSNTPLASIKAIVAGTEPRAH